MLLALHSALQKQEPVVDSSTAQHSTAQHSTAHLVLLESAKVEVTSFGLHALLQS